LSKDTLERLKHGERIVEILKQPQYEPLPVERQVILLFMLTNKYFASVNVENVQKAAHDFLSFVEERHVEIINEIKQTSEVSAALGEKIKAAGEEFMKNHAHAGDK
jgi:F-type H+-transporting ATPase subunit alpha